MQAVPIRNRSKMEQYIITEEGARVALLAYETKVVKPHIAEMFTQQCTPHVVRESSVNQIVDDVPVEERVWLYNTTGDPDADKKIESVRIEKGGNRVIDKIDNPKANTIVIKHELQGGQKMAKVRGETTALQMASRIEEVWPFVRKAVSRDTANSMLTRDAEQSPLMQGCIKVARAPAPHEPNDQWSLRDLHIYADMVGIKKRGKTEETLTKEFEDGKHKGNALEVVLDDAKTELFRRLFFKIADPDCPIPSAEAWTAYLARVESNLEDSSE